MLVVFAVPLCAQQINLQTQVKGLLQPVNGGMGFDTSSVNGCPKVTGGVWSFNPANCSAAASLSTERMGSWVDGTYGYGLYDHHYTPNSTSFDCISVLHDSQGNNLALSMGWKAARSWHPGGANVLFGDGSVHFMKNSIDGRTWAAMGTRAGGEVISSQ